MKHSDAEPRCSIQNRTDNIVDNICGVFENKITGAMGRTLVHVHTLIQVTSLMMDLWPQYGRYVWV